MSHTFVWYISEKTKKNKILASLYRQAFWKERSMSVQICSHRFNISVWSHACLKHNKIKLCHFCFLDIFSQKAAGMRFLQYDQRLTPICENSLFTYYHCNCTANNQVLTKHLEYSVQLITKGLLPNPKFAFLFFSVNSLGMLRVWTDDQYRKERKCN